MHKVLEGGAVPDNPLQIAQADLDETLCTCIKAGFPKALVIYILWFAMCIMLN